MGGGGWLQVLTSYRELSRKAARANNMWWHVSGLLGDGNRVLMYGLLQAVFTVRAHLKALSGTECAVMDGSYMGFGDTHGSLMLLAVERFMAGRSRVIGKQGFGFWVLQWMASCLPGPVSCPPN